MNALTPKELVKLRLAIGMMGGKELVDIPKVETITGRRFRDVFSRQHTLYHLNHPAFPPFSLGKAAWIDWRRMYEEKVNGPNT